MSEYLVVVNLYVSLLLSVQVLLFVYRIRAGMAAPVTTQGGSRINVYARRTTSVQTANVRIIITVVGFAGMQSTRMPLLMG